MSSPSPLPPQNEHRDTIRCVAWDYTEPVEYDDRPRRRRKKRRAPHPDSVLTLTECFEKFVLPWLERTDKAAGTINGYRIALRAHWVPYTGNPAVGAIDDDLIEKFWDRFLREKLATDTYRKNWAHILKILRTIGPKDWSNRDGKGIIRFVPARPDIPRTAKRKVREVSLEQITALYEACGDLEEFWPRTETKPIPAEVHRLAFRTALVVWWCHGPRKMDLFEHLTWKQVTLGESPCPDPDIRVTSPHGWLYFTPEKIRRRRPEPIAVPLTAASARHLAAVKSLGRGERIIPLSTCTRTIERQWRQLRKRALGPDSDRVLMKCLRKSANINWRMLHPDLGPAVLGHAELTVNSESYWDAVRLLVEKTPDYPMPDCFLKTPLP